VTDFAFRLRSSEVGDTMNDPVTTGRDLKLCSGGTG
jgi:hypothetical protein